MQRAFFQFCCHVESMTIDYHEVIRLDARLRAMKFCFHFCHYYKIIPSQKRVTLTLENNLFASVGCENVKIVQNTDYR